MNIHSFIALFSTHIGDMTSEVLGVCTPYGSIFYAKLKRDGRVFALSFPPK
jgi:hypothetical protein